MVHIQAHRPDQQRRGGLALPTEHPDPHDRLNLYVLLPLFHQEASLLPLQVILLSQKMMYRQQRKEDRSKEQKLQDLWAQYSATSRTPTTEYLHRVSDLIGYIDHCSSACQHPTSSVHQKYELSFFKYVNNKVWMDVYDCMDVPILCMYGCIHVCMYVCVCICMYLYMYVYVCMGVQSNLVTTYPVYNVFTHTTYKFQSPEFP